MVHATTMVKKMVECRVICKYMSLLSLLMMMNSWERVLSHMHQVMVDYVYRINPYFLG